MISYLISFISAATNFIWSMVWLCVSICILILSGVFVLSLWNVYSDDFKEVFKK